MDEWLGVMRLNYLYSLVGSLLEVRLTIFGLDLFVSIEGFF